MFSVSKGEPGAACEVLFGLAHCSIVLFRPEEKIKLLEKRVNELIEESCMAQSIGSLQLVRVTIPLYTTLFRPSRR